MSSTANGTNGTNGTFDYDLIVVGGGSGGLAAAKAAAKANPSAKVACFDFVTPTQFGTKWGLGGTCVNVGCIPKKLMHHSGTIGYMMSEHAEQFGWSGLENRKHDWATMSHLIKDYIRSLNFSYRTQLRAANVNYIEAHAQFVDSHTVSYYNKSKKQQMQLRARQFIIATGGRPTYPTEQLLPGAKLAISSDDLFWRNTSPGKTLVIGAGYIALECASFLHHTGHDVSVMVRGEILRKMDKQAGQMIGELMERDGVRFIHPASPVSFAKADSTLTTPPAESKEIAPGLYEVPSTKAGLNRFFHSAGFYSNENLSTGEITYEIPEGPITASFKYNNDSSNTLHTETFDTVLLAIGRSANIHHINLPSTGVQTVNGKILVDDNEQTTVPHIWAIGDVATGIPQHQPNADPKHLSAIAVDRPELTPVAIVAGQLLAQRVWGQKVDQMNYGVVPTTVFTSPSEYAFVGLSEEQALLPRVDGGIGAENVEIYYSRFGSIEISPLHPHYITPRSNAFIGTSLWASQFADKHGLDWSEVTFEEGNYVQVQIDGQWKDARINAKVSENQHITYDIELDDEIKTEMKGISGNAIRRLPADEEENSAMMVKANCLAKLIVDKSQNEKVVGLHFVGSTAGEVLQGFALAVQLGVTKHDFDKLIGIHPTIAEEFAVLTTAKSSLATPLKKAGCGGGSCG